MASTDFQRARESAWQGLDGSTYVLLPSQKLIMSPVYQMLRVQLIRMEGLLF